MPIEHDEIRGEPDKQVVRMVTFEGEPPNVERVLQLAREQVQPHFRGQPGWQGMLGLASLDGRRGLVLSFWESESALFESGANAVDVRASATAAGISVADDARLQIVFDGRGE